MYSHCLFCHADLGRNTRVEAFTVGRRLAYDAAKGRLWVVCCKCERWNLTPLEERWEAIDEAERLYRGTKLRVATDQVGLARFTDDHGRFELVRIGKPLRPELAAWRYGDQFGRRRRRHLAYAAGAATVGGAMVVAGPIMGLGVSVVLPLLNLVNVANVAYSARAIVRVPVEASEPPLTLRRKHLGTVRLLSDRYGWRLTLTAILAHDPSAPWWRYEAGVRETTVTLTGAAAVRAAGALLPPCNQSGGSAHRVQEAVSLLEQHASPERLFDAVARESRRRFKASSWQFGEEGMLSDIPVAMRLALEMAAHEDTERRAMEGELALLEAAWKDAEEIAKIADAL